MRKLIVKYFALDYKCEFFGKTVTFVRAANVIVPVFFLNGILEIANESGPRTTLDLIPLGLLAVGSFFGRGDIFIEYGVGISKEFEGFGTFVQVSNWNGTMYVTPGISFSL